MTQSVAVIIPTRNNAGSIEAAIASAIIAGASEVIVSDGGSTDDTLARAARAGAKTLASAKVRGAQLNHAADRSSANILLFLHADSALPREGIRQAVSALENGFVFGGFRIRFSEDRLMLRLAAALINTRSRMTRCPWGDQGQFITRRVFFDAGGYLEYPLMDDYELATRMKRRGGTIIVPSYITTSGTRFLERGFIRTPLLNWRTILMYRMGADPFELEKRYRK